MTIEQKQHLLAYLGYYRGRVDGIWGELSQDATVRLQAAQGLDPDGIWGDLTTGAAKYAVEHDMFAAEEEPKPTGGDWWDNIRYWSREEFRCRCGEYHAPYCNGFPVEPDRTLVELVDDLRHRLGAPGHRSSGIRCVKHNKDSKGVSDSRHLSGKALDFYIEGVSGERLLAAAQADKRTRYAYIIKPGQPYVHVDVR